MNTCGLCFITGKHKEFKTKQELNEHVGMFHGFEVIEKHRTKLNDINSKENIK